MTYEYYLSLFLFAFVCSATPGPNNIMLLASGMNHGVIRTVPHMFGIGLGFPLMLILIGIGLTQIFEYIPYANLVLKIGCSGYMLYLAWKIATAEKPKRDNLAKLDSLAKSGEHSGSSNPLTFWQAAGFQWINPKAWVMATSAISLYTPPGHSNFSLIVIALAFVAASIPATNIWVILGSKLSTLIEDERKRMAFNITCALLLVATLYPILVA